MKYQQFVFKDYAFEPATKTATFSYGLDDALTFQETYQFNFDFAAYDPAALDRALQGLFFMAGVSYYKTFLPPHISVTKGNLDPASAAFLSKTYQRGLGEFFYTNQLDPQTPVVFPATNHLTPPVATAPPNQGLLIGLGGGKDSLVTIELLRQQAKVATWSVGHRKQLAPLVERVGLPHFWVERTWDRQLLALNQDGAYNGHVPISAILACAGSVVAVLTGYQDVVVSNENSANEPTLTYRGVAINHQYSKSLEFEQDFQAYLQRNFGELVRYYSFLRPLSELRIAQIFAQVGWAKYHDVFSSCNRAFTHDSPGLFWCGHCPKCAFVFLALTPFVKRSNLEELFGGRNLLLDPQLEPLYRQILGIEGNKPLECVGEVKESRAAMRLAQTTHPELRHYHFDLPTSYDYRTLAPHSMPSEQFKILQAALQASK